MSGLRWLRNEFNPLQPGPIVRKGKFQAGSTQAITKGQMLEFTGDTDTAWVPVDSDHDMTAAGGIAVAAQDISAGDSAGYYEVWFPIPGDVWDVELAADSAVVFGTALYYSTNVKLTVTAGSNVIAYTVGEVHYPDFQNRLSQGELGDNGTTIRTISRAQVAFRWTCSAAYRLFVN